MNESIAAILKRLENCKYSMKEELPTIKDYFILNTNKITNNTIYFTGEMVKLKEKFIYCENDMEPGLNLKYIFSQNHWDSVFCCDSEVQSILSDSEIPFTSSNDDLINLQAGLTKYEYLVARFGTVEISSRQLSRRRLSAYSPVHIEVAYSSQLVPELDEAQEGLKVKYNQIPSMISFFSRTSCTVNIEKTLVMGSHGSKDLIVFLTNNT